MITMSILGPVPPYHVLAFLQLRNVGHAEVLRVELDHLCTICSIFEETSFMVIHMQSGSHCGS